MADSPVITTTRVTRDKLAAVFKNHELITAFENLTNDVISAIPDAIVASTEDYGSITASNTFGRRDPAMLALLLAATDVDRVLTQASFAPRHDVTPTPDDDAGRILASQIFGG